MKKRLLLFIKNFSKKIKSQDGFSMIEIMIVIAIIAILSGLAVSTFRGSLDKSRIQAVKTDFSTFETVLEKYYLDNSTYPSTEEGLQKLIDAGLLRNKKNMLKDPWGMPYQYAYPSEHDKDIPDIWSFGADKKEGGTGIKADINNWDQ